MVSHNFERNPASSLDSVVIRWVSVSVSSCSSVEWNDDVCIRKQRQWLMVVQHSDADLDNNAPGRQPASTTPGIRSHFPPRNELHSDLERDPEWRRLLICQQLPECFLQCGCVGVRPQHKSLVQGCIEQWLCGACLSLPARRLSDSNSFRRHARFRRSEVLWFLSIFLRLLEVRRCS